MIPSEYIKNLYKAVLVLLVVLSVFFAVRIFKGFDYRGMKGAGDTNIITISGHGEVQAVPDIANVYFTIRKEGKTVKEAQEAVVVVEKKALDILKENKVEDKDIQTTNASFNPKYEYRYDAKVAMPCNQYGCPPNPGSSVIVGYEAYESITVKLRVPDDVGKVMQGLGTVGVTDLSGPNFAIDNEEGLKMQARKEAIDDAREKAEVLAKDLGVRLGKISSFNESGNYPMPLYYGKDMMAGNAIAESAPAALPKGENTISSDVTITYEIR